MFTHYQRFHYARHLASLLHITILHFLTCLCLSLPLCPDWLRNLMMEWLNNNNPLTLIYKFNNKNYITVFEMPFVCVVSGWRISSAPAVHSPVNTIHSSAHSYGSCGSFHQSPQKKYCHQSPLVCAAQANPLPCWPSLKSTNLYPSLWVMPPMWPEDKSVMQFFLDCSWPLLKTALIPDVCFLL